MSEPLRLRRRALALALALAVMPGCATLFQRSIEALMSDGVSLYEAGSYAESIARFDEVIRRDPGHWLAYLYMARSLLAMADWLPAITNARRAFELAPEQGETGETLGRALLGGGLAALRAGQLGDAVTRLAEYLTLRPGDPRGYLGLAQAHSGNGDLAAAGRVLLDGLRRGDGGGAELLGEISRVARQALERGDASVASDLLARYVRERPRDVPALLDLGKAYWQTGNTAQALETFGQVLGLSPGNAEALRYMGQGLMR